MTIKTTLIDGDPLDPQDSDMFAQTTNVSIGLMPDGEGWRSMTGNQHTNLWGRVCYRYELDDGDPAKGLRDLLQEAQDFIGDVHDRAVSLGDEPEGGDLYDRIQQELDK